MRKLLPALLAAAAIAGCGGGDDQSGDTGAATDTTTAPTTTTQAPPTEGRDRGAPRRLPTGTIATDLDVPWELVFLPDRTALVTERGGTVRRLDRNLTLEKQPIARIEVEDQGEGGLLGMAIDPEFESNKFVYVYRTTGDGNEVLRYTYDGGLTKPRTVVDDIQAGFIHDGGRLRFGPDDALYVTTGEAGEPDLAQDDDSLNGKILRVENPAAGGSSRPEVISNGHRNVQGIDWQPRTSRLFVTEFGPDANDEVNEIREGRDYGWPDAQGAEGPTPAFIDYEDVIAPSGATFVKRSGSRWTGDLLIATLRGEHLRRVTIDGDQVTRDDAMYQGRFGRLRQVVEGPDGGIYLLTNNRDGRGSPGDEDDRIIRIVPPRD